ncbi:FTR1 family iron permease, partial [Arthrobacter sp. Hiyo1]|uniref:FTR1 family iron permease n=1 Tax=Arthrobacter sp. Hiyo1 TaxID=1588020 RepID=UPI000AFBA9EB
LHRGVLKVNLSRFFTWTGVGLIVIAGGVLAYGIHDLQEAGILPGLHTLAFDVSAAIPPSSWYGTLLKGTLNLSPATTWLEAGAWLLYVIPVLYFYIRANGSSPKKSTGNAPRPKPPTLPKSFPPPTTEGNPHAWHSPAQNSPAHNGFTPPDVPRPRRRCRRRAARTHRLHG